MLILMDGTRDSEKLLDLSVRLFNQPNNQYNATFINGIRNKHLEDLFEIPSESLNYYYSYSDILDKILHTEQDNSNEFIELLDENPHISKSLLKALSHELGVVEERVQSLAQKSVRERLAETLLFLQSTFSSEQNEDVISITLPREDIANIVGTATETVIRLLSDFKSDKLIELEGKKIRILNKKGLEKISHASV